jgi:ABC-2 type transport system permease protein
MRNILAVAGKELRSYFHSPIAYLVMAVYAVLCGFFFYSFSATYVVQTFRMQAMGGMGMPNMTINDYVIRPLFQGVLSIVLLLVIPLITMRLYAEEKRSGTIELLLTSPVTDFQIIMGKFLGALTLFGAMVAITFVYVSTLFVFGNPSAKPLIAQAVGLLLFGASLLALGMWISTFTKNQIIAAVVSFAVFLLIYVLNWVTAYSSGAFSKVLAYLALTTHFEGFAKGVVDLKDLVYYLSVIALGVFLTARSVEALKGRV